MYFACWRHTEVDAVQGDTTVINGVANVLMKGFTVHICIL